MEDDTLARITQSSEAVADAERNLRQAVAIARNAQRTWAQIGDALGVTRQAAQRKYGNAQIGRTLARMPDDLYDPVCDNVELPPELGAPLRDRIIDQVLFLNANDRHRRETLPLSIIVNDDSQAFTVDVTPIYRYRPI